MKKAVLENCKRYILQTNVNFVSYFTKSRLVKQLDNLLEDTNVKTLTSEDTLPPQICNSLLVALLAIDDNNLLIALSGEFKHTLAKTENTATTIDIMKVRIKIAIAAIELNETFLSLSGDVQNKISLLKQCITWKYLSPERLLKILDKIIYGDDDPISPPLMQTTYLGKLFLMNDLITKTNYIVQKRKNLLLSLFSDLKQIVENHKAQTACQHNDAQSSISLLPDELWVAIFQRLGSAEAVKAVAPTCRKFQNIGRDEALKNLSAIYISDDNLIKRAIRIIEKELFRPCSYKFLRLTDEDKLLLRRLLSLFAQHPQRYDDTFQRELFVLCKNSIYFLISVGAERQRYAEECLATIRTHIADNNLYQEISNLYFADPIRYKTEITFEKIIADVRANKVCTIASIFHHYIEDDRRHYKEEKKTASSKYVTDHAREKNYCARNFRSRIILTETQLEKLAFACIGNTSLYGASDYLPDEWCTHSGLSITAQYNIKFINAVVKLNNAKVSLKKHREWLEAEKKQGKTNFINTLANSTNRLFLKLTLKSAEFFKTLFSYVLGLEPIVKVSRHLPFGKKVFFPTVALDTDDLSFFDSSHIDKKARIGMGVKGYITNPFNFLLVLNHLVQGNIGKLFGVCVGTCLFALASPLSLPLAYYEYRNSAAKRYADDIVQDLQKIDDCEKDIITHYISHIFRLANLIHPGAIQLLSMRLNKMLSKVNLDLAQEKLILHLGALIDTLNSAHPHNYQILFNIGEYLNHLEYKALAKKALLKIPAENALFRDAQLLLIMTNDNQSSAALTYGHILAQLPLSQDKSLHQRYSAAAYGTFEQEKSQLVNNAKDTANAALQQSLTQLTAKLEKFGQSEDKQRYAAQLLHETSKLLAAFNNAKNTDTNKREVLASYTALASQAPGNQSDEHNKQSSMLSYCTFGLFGRRKVESTGIAQHMLDICNILASQFYSLPAMLINDERRPLLLSGASN